jgi:NAD(P)-dependent dehydrogenase (short-subunit alcohol dehydrogenase family)
MAPRFFVEVLAKELGPRAVTVNSILPTVTVGAGLSTDAVRLVSGQHLLLTGGGPG